MFDRFRWVDERADVHRDGSGDSALSVRFGPLPFLAFSSASSSSPVISSLLVRRAERTSAFTSKSSQTWIWLCCLVLHRNEVFKVIREWALLDNSASHLFIQREISSDEVGPLGASRSRWPDRCGREVKSK